MFLWRTFLRIRNVLLNCFKHGPKKGATWMCFSLSHLLHNVLEDWSYVAWRVILRNRLVLFPFLFFFFSKWRSLFYKTYFPLRLSIYFILILRISSIYLYVYMYVYNTQLWNQPFVMSQKRWYHSQISDNTPRQVFILSCGCVVFVPLQMWRVCF